MPITSEEAREIIQEILDLYKIRGGTQAEITQLINEKYRISLTINDVSDITKQEGYRHTVLRDKTTKVVTQIPEEIRSRMSHR